MKEEVRERVMVGVHPQHCNLQNENRMKLLTNLEDSTGSLLTGSIKMSTLGSYGDLYVSDGEVSRSPASEGPSNTFFLRMKRQQKPRDSLSLRPEESRRRSRRTASLSRVCKVSSCFHTKMEKFVVSF